MGYHRIHGSFPLRLYSFTPGYVLICYMSGKSYDDFENQDVYAKVITWHGEVIGYVIVVFR